MPVARTYLPFSASKDGRGVAVQGNQIAKATLIHTNPLGSRVQNKLRIYVANAQDATDRQLFLVIGTLDETSMIAVTIPAQQGLFAAIPELSIGPSGVNAPSVWAFVNPGDEGKLSIFGTYDVSDATPQN
jgi:hypothetical protein